VDSVWWLPKKHPDLSQEDVFKGIPVWVAIPPVVFIQKQTFSGNQTAWVESSNPIADADGFKHLLARAREVVCIVLTHDCQLDKAKKKVRVQVAVASDVNALSSEERSVVMNQRSLSMLVLPNIPQLGTYYADMRLIFTVDKRLLIESMRIASMTEQAKLRVQNQLIAYFSDRARPDSSS